MVEITIKNVLLESNFIFIHVKIFYIHLLADYVFCYGLRNCNDQTFRQQGCVHNEPPFGSKMICKWHLNFNPDIQKHSF